MASFNKILLIGNLTRDVELRYTPAGNAVGSTAVACNRKWRDEQGNAKEEVTFVDITLWGKTAETVAKFCTKGSSVHIDGRLKTESWEDKQTGAKRSKLIVVAEGVQFLGGKQDGQPQQQAAPHGQRRTAADSARDAQQAGPFNDAAGGDDIPF